jgi:F0F1-type ATP synthase epsilon subunit
VVPVSPMYKVDKDKPVMFLAKKEMGRIEEKNVCGINGVCAVVTPELATILAKEMYISKPNNKIKSERKKEMPKIALNKKKREKKENKKIKISFFNNLK